MAERLTEFMGKTIEELKVLIDASEFVGTTIQAWEDGFNKGKIKGFEQAIHLPSEMDRHMYWAVHQHLKKNNITDPRLAIGEIYRVAIDFARQRNEMTRCSGS